MSIITQVFIVLGVLVYITPSCISLYKYFELKLLKEEVVEQYECIYLDDMTDSKEVEELQIIHNNNRALFPFDELPEGIYEYSEDIDPDSGIYSDDREVGI